MDQRPFFGFHAQDLNEDNHDNYDHKYDDEIQVMWGQGQLPPGSVPMWGPGMPGEIISFMLMNYLDIFKIEDNSR